MRKGCYDCVRKHLAQAQVLCDESMLGYPEHKWLAVGHMAEAEAESLELDPSISLMIREVRLQIIDDNFSYPITDLIKRVSDTENKE